MFCEHRTRALFSLLAVQTGWRARPRLAAPCTGRCRLSSQHSHNPHGHMGMGHGSLPSSCLEAPTHALWLHHACPRSQQQEQNGTTPQREPSSALALLRRAASRQASSRALRPCRWIASRSAAAVLFRRWESFRRASSLRRSRAADCSFASAVLSLRVCAHCCFCAAYAVSELFGGGASFRLPPLPIAGQRGASTTAVAE